MRCSPLYCLTVFLSTPSRRSECVCVNSRRRRSSHSRVSSPSSFLFFSRRQCDFCPCAALHISLSLSHTHTHTLALSHGHRSVRDSHGEVEKRLFSLLFLNSEIRIDDTIRIPPHTTLSPMRSETESRFSQVQYGTLFSSSWLWV